MWNRKNHIEFFPADGHTNGTLLMPGPSPPVYLNSSPVYVLGSR